MSACRNWKWKSGNNAWLTYPNAVLTIRDATPQNIRTYDNYEVLYHATPEDISRYQNLDIVYREEESLINGSAVFTYQIPQDSWASMNKINRYLISVYEAGNDSPKYALFFLVKQAGLQTNIPLVLGIGATIAGAVAFYTLKKRRQG